MSHTLKKCDICTYVSTKTANVKRHMKRHDNPKLEPVGPLHCPDCDKTFEIKKYLTAHRKTHVEGLAKEKKKCSICEYESNDGSNLKRHMDTHIPNTLPPIKSHNCSICDFACNKGSNLTKHMNTHRPNTVSQFEVTKCDECDKTFHTRKSLKAHKNIYAKINQVNC